MECLSTIVCIYAAAAAAANSFFKARPWRRNQSDTAWSMRSPIRHSRAIPVAREFNISQTGYLTRLSGSTGAAPRFGLRWFTTVAEVRLCGHATLAAAHYLFANDLVNSDTIEFSTLSGILTAKRVPKTKLSDSSISENGSMPNGFFIELDFPVVPVYEYAAADAEILSICKSINVASLVEVHKTTTTDDFLVVLPSGKAVEEFKPDIDEIQKLPGRGMIVTGLAPLGSGFDFFSRFFCPKLGINEDPVCGSAHCALVPYWSKKLGKRDLVAFQASPRSGILYLQLDEKKQRMLLRGEAITVMEGTLLV